MIIKLVRWLFERTPFGKLIDGKKTEIGVILCVVWLILQGLTSGLEQVALNFPGIDWIKSLQIWSVALDSLIGQVAGFLGISLTGIGLAHDKVKRDNIGG